MPFLIVGNVNNLQNTLFIIWQWTSTYVWYINIWKYSWKISLLKLEYPYILIIPGKPVYENQSKFWIEISIDEFFKYLLIALPTDCPVGRARDWWSDVYWGSNGAGGMVQEKNTR